ncbi:ATP-dependent Clp protease ATP-binding subunit [Candidatus Saccharibacteria bacterium]|nr:MAG: ATP-dependent Clp protease ATP-binding subunit [Candidatus Saccharibacteria bacterium]
MAEITLHATRARKARLGASISPVFVMVLFAAGVLLVLCGLALLFSNIAVGWLFVGLAAIPVMCGVWDTYDLNDIPAGTGAGIDQILESSVLGKLPQDVTPKAIALAAPHSAAARFMIVRFELSAKVLSDLASDKPADAEAVWQLAEQYRVQLKSDILRGDMLVAALCVTQPGLAQLLPHLQLEPADLILGMRWYSRIQEIIKQAHMPRQNGGIARDWNFGYANLLERFGVNMSQQGAHGGMFNANLESHHAVTAQLQSVFAGEGRQNAAIVGKLGVGKTTIAQAFATNVMTGGGNVPGNLRYSQVIRLDAGTLIRFARNRTELEDIVQRLFVEAFRAKNIILFLDDAQLFFEESNGSVDLSSALMPIIESGRLRIFMAMDEQAYLRISQRNPALVSALNRINVTSGNEADTMSVLQEQIIRLESEHKVTFTHQGLKEGYRLSERYMYDLAQPGRAVRLLEQAARQANNGFVTAESVAAAIELSSGVKVAPPANDTAERDRLLNMEDLIHQRMVNQSRAVTAVSNALRRARAGVRNEKRPIGTFLFLGPTGVGKTELAKALAAVYFGGEDRIVRIDLNEFVRLEDVSRLIADGANEPHGLTASILKQPFSVVLLDEVEKAHPQVLTTLLQLLDEGVLRDVNNREVSFRDAIVIATSNAGAEQIRQLIDEGKKLEEFEDSIVDELIDRQQFRPEFLNRFDEIVVFRPLTEEELGQVVERMITEVNSTLKTQKIQVQLTPEAVQRLAAIGYDPRLGARPMRRVVQRSVEDLVAKRILEGTAQPGQTVTITDSDILTR